jgi:hypothetical protein
LLQGLRQAREAEGTRFKRVALFPSTFKRRK